MEIHMLQTVCSPVYHCFPPRPTACLICKKTDVSECPYKKEK